MFIIYIVKLYIELYYILLSLIIIKVSIINNWSVVMTNPEFQKTNANNKTRTIIITLFSLIIIALLVFSIFTVSILTDKKIHKGVFINDINVSRMYPEEVTELLEKELSTKVSKEVIVLNYGNSSLELKFSDMNLSYNIKDAVNNAYNSGRTGNLFSRINNILSSGKKTTVIDLTYSCDEKYIEDKLENFYKDTLIPVKEASLFLGDSEVTITSGHPGKSIEKQKALEFINSSIKTCIGGTFDLPEKITQPTPINADKIYEQITIEPEDAKVSVNDNIVTVDVHRKGRKIDKAALSSIINDLNNTTDTAKKLPVEFIEPEITASYIDKVLFRDKLSEASTKFNTNSVNNANRGVNIRLASSKINGKILAPGEVFSFNDYVGPRTTEAGYKAAHAYIAGKIVDDVGGGICQVSTTLYNSVLFADLETISRKNHMFTVSYVALGRDAAVFYGETDFKFKNNTKWPIKLEASVSKDNKLTFAIIGTNETPEKKIELSHVTVKTIPPQVKYIDDPTMEAGKTVVVNSGMTGYVVDTYKIVKMSDNIISKAFLHKSTYNSYAKEVKRGTKKVAASPPASAKDMTLE